VEPASTADAADRSTPAELAVPTTSEARRAEWPLRALFLGGVLVLYALVGFGLYTLLAFMF
jgi:hypothetical protein